MDNPNVIILAGPNGAGKSTISQELFGGAADRPHYVNADTIARGLSAFRSEELALEAGRIMLDYLKKLGVQKSTFAFETTLATKSFAPWIRELKGAGYIFRLFYLWLPAAEMAVQRVKDRVTGGGHHVPEETVRRRYKRGLENFFQLYRPIADSWKFYNNANPKSPIEIADGNGIIENSVHDPIWHEIKKEYGNG